MRLESGLLLDLRQVLAETLGEPDVLIRSMRLDGSGYIVGSAIVGEEPFGFAAKDGELWLPIAGQARFDAGQADKCQKGTQCGETCIAQGELCRIGLSKMNAGQVRLIKAVLSAPSKPVAATQPSKSLTPFLRGLTSPKLLGAGGLVLAGGVLASVIVDAKKSELTEDEIKHVHFTDDDLPDAKTMEKYDTFKPGDMLRKAVKNPGLGVRWHYAIYIGKDEAGEHRIVESHLADAGYPEISNNSIFMKGQLGGSEYDVEEVADSPVGKKFTPEEIVDRAKKMAGTPFMFRGFANNCETFARTMAEGRAYSTQEKRTRALTNVVVAGIMQGGLIAGAARKGQKIKLTTSSEMLTILDGMAKSGEKWPADRGLPDAAEYVRATEAAAAMAPKLSNRIRVQSCKNYLLAAFAHADARKRRVAA